MKAIIFEENRYDDLFKDDPHIYRGLANFYEDKFHVCDKCKNFVFQGIIIPEAGNLTIQLWSNFASRYLGAHDFTVDVFKDFDLPGNSRIIGKIEISNPEVLIRRAKQFDKINGFWTSHKNKISDNLRKALYRDVEELLKKAQPQSASQRNWQTRVPLD